MPQSSAQWRLGRKLNFYAVLVKARRSYDRCAFFISMTKVELITQIEDERAELEALLETLSPEQMQQPGVMGQWSVKDILAHLAVWAARTITLMFAIERKAKPTYPQPGRDVDDVWASVNAKDYAEQKERSLDEVLIDFRGTHTQLLKRITNWKDDTLLFDTRKFNLRGQSLADIILSNSVEHDAEHGGIIEQWAAR